MIDIGTQGGTTATPGSGYWYDDEAGSSARIRAVLEALRTYRAAESAMRRRTRDSMSMGDNELLALRYLMRRPERTARPSDLSAYLGISGAAVTTMIERLEKGGQLTRVLEPGDSGTVLVRTTEQADDEVRRTLGAMHTRMHDVAAGMSPDAQQHVVAFLQAMADAVDQVEPAPAP